MAASGGGAVVVFVIGSFVLAMVASMVGDLVVMAGRGAVRVLRWLRWLRR